MKYLIILEPSANGFSAYSPDLNGCIAAGSSREETVALMRKAIVFRLEELAETGRAIPNPSSEPAFVEVPNEIGFPFVQLPDELAASTKVAENFNRVDFLQKSVIKFDDPFGPAVAENEWEACR